MSGLLVLLVSYVLLFHADVYKIPWQPAFVSTVEFECPHDDCSATCRFNFMNIQVQKKDIKTITCHACKRNVRFEYQISQIQRGRKYRDADWLYKEYVENNKTMAEIATMCDTTPMTIHHWLKKHGIESRRGGTR